MAAGASNLSGWRLQGSTSPTGPRTWAGAGSVEHVPGLRADPRDVGPGAHRRRVGAAVDPRRPDRSLPVPALPPGRALRHGGVRRVAGRARLRLVDAGSRPRSHPGPRAARPRDRRGPAHLGDWPPHRRSDGWPRAATGRAGLRRRRPTRATAGCRPRRGDRRRTRRDGGRQPRRLAGRAARGDLVEALAVLAAVPSFRPSVDAWVDPAFEVSRRFPDGAESLGIPTWHYGHEPPNSSRPRSRSTSATRPAKRCCSRSATAGIVFLPGAAGTVQEIFQDACENYYADESTVAPMVLVGDGLLDPASSRPGRCCRAWPAGGRWSPQVHLVDTVEEAVELHLRGRELSPAPSVTPMEISRRNLFRSGRPRSAPPLPLGGRPGRGRSPGRRRRRPVALGTTLETRPRRQRRQARWRPVRPAAASRTCPHRPRRPRPDGTRGAAHRCWPSPSSGTSTSSTPVARARVG